MQVRHGIDLVSVKRIEAIIKRQGISFLNRVFTPGERKYCEGKRRKFEHYAARFAAKEAVIKALEEGNGFRNRFREIEVKKKASGKPYIFMTQKTKKKFGIGRGFQMELSMAHEHEYAIATFLLVSP